MCRSRAGAIVASCKCTQYKRVGRRRSGVAPFNCVRPPTTGRPGEKIRTECANVGTQLGRCRAREQDQKSFFHFIIMNYYCDSVWCTVYVRFCVPICGSLSVSSELRALSSPQQPSNLTRIK